MILRHLLSDFNERGLLNIQAKERKAEGLSKFPKYSKGKKPKKGPKKPKNGPKPTKVPNNDEQEDPGEDVCEDFLKIKKCRKLKAKDKCSKKWVAKKCALTCGFCEQNGISNNL